MASAPCVCHPQSSDGVAAVRRPHIPTLAACIAVAVFWIERHELARLFRSLGL